MQQWLKIRSFDGNQRETDQRHCTLNNTDNSVYLSVLNWVGYRRSNEMYIHLKDKSKIITFEWGAFWSKN